MPHSGCFHVIFSPEYNAGPSPTGAGQRAGKARLFASVSNEISLSIYSGWVVSGSISQREYAARRGVTAGAIWQAVRAGRIPALPDGRIDPEAADAVWYRRHQQTEAENRAGAAAELRREQAVLTSTLAKIQTLRRRHAKLAASLVERDKSEAAIADLVTRLLEAIPRLPERAASPNDAKLLREAVGLILADMGDLHGEAMRAMANL